MPRKVSERVHWLQSEFGGRRIYLCWYCSAGSFGQKVVYRTLLGKVDR